MIQSCDSGTCHSCPAAFFFPLCFPPSPFFILLFLPSFIFSSSLLFPLPFLLFLLLPFTSPPFSLLSLLSSPSPFSLSSLLFPLPFLLSQYLERLELVPVFKSEEEIAHWFLPQPDIVTCYVVEVCLHIVFGGRKKGRQRREKKREMCEFAVTQ